MQLCALFSWVFVLSTEEKQQYSRQWLSDITSGQLDEISPDVFGEVSLLFISCNLTPGFTSLYLFRLKELLCLLRPRQKYPQKSLAPMCQRCDNAYGVKQHSIANGPEREFARDARAQIRGVMDPLSVLEHQVMVGN